MATLVCFGFGYSAQAWLAAHGVLHLLGLDDRCESDRTRMIDLQDRILHDALAEEDTQTP